MRDDEGEGKRSVREKGPGAGVGRTFQFGDIFGV